MLFFASFGAKIAVFPINFFDYTKKLENYGPKPIPPHLVDR